jgi:hypothetical protein
MRILLRSYFKSVPCYIKCCVVRILELNVMFYMSVAFEHI